ncbi:hypothetical protein MAA5396_04843 [Marinovum algicola]|uniref:Uncharacterized protein n=1 Tax=Marinovum algicola TaxID=42444 RepID=A0A975WF59_9RHOB|nr:hypothetical protein [Marinovum algicola]SEK10272.1 hypothetical protein SAMN04487940_13229 [Marinovum algicola]SLN76904.1 hypothetical protein MAA5396_04843 [Marinovum algicola]
MGNDRRYKGLLLDEADFALPRNCDMEALTEAVEGYLVPEFSDEFDRPSLEIIGVVSEGLGQTTACSSDHVRPTWVKPDIEFRDIVLGIAIGLGFPEPLAITTLETGRTDGIEAHLENRIRALVEDRDYDGARMLMEHLSGLRSSGIPGVIEASSFDTRGEDEIVDFRVNNYGPGRRILAEIAFNWGQ